MQEKSKAINQVAKDLTNDFDDWTKSLEESEQPTACNIHDDSCESCSG